MLSRLRLAPLVITVAVFASPALAGSREAPDRLTNRTGAITINFLDGVSPDRIAPKGPRAVPQPARTAPTPRMQVSPTASSDPIGRIIALRTGAHCCSQRQH
ncbi:hypothetical protein [Novosphingobium sp.]|uniref:hypothetical protein n=1 Tax=Novosphingobium sp. TaxID=1874826 RepID=UPI003561E2F0